MILSLPVLLGGLPAAAAARRGAWDALHVGVQGCRAVVDSQTVHLGMAQNSYSIACLRLICLIFLLRCCAFAAVRGHQGGACCCLHHTLYQFTSSSWVLHFWKQQVEHKKGGAVVMHEVGDVHCLPAKHRQQDPSLL
ncbi:hypothetical protein COO60DRAFT_572887 [Scenedesmus sp. NREL 46B-D3]|nr:hypothetical protein COO60DRAFT_572887 [Scenedesmus sp. NREL 46B-D3]